MKPVINALLFFLMTFDVGLATDNDPIVVIVHPSNQFSDISTDELRRAYSGGMQRWQDGQKLLVLENPLEHEIRATFHRVILKDDPAKQYFLPDSPVLFMPTVRSSSRSIVIYCKRFKNAIGYVRLSEVRPGVKILTINGLGPDDDAYIFE